ncbi:MAG: PilX N-terminal domain-containing pilus assembly protein [Chlamydiota bacterium]
MIRKSKSERGMALIVVLFALMLLTAVGLGLMYMTTTETGIDDNFRSEQQAYYASKAGLEEARERLRKYAPNAIIPPTWPPSTTNPGGVVYLINPAGPADSVTPWVAGSTYFDDELCHENYNGLGLAQTDLTVPCATAPTGNWYTVANPQSTDPYTNTSASIPYKWVRITLKQVGSTAPWCLNSPGAGTCPNAGTQVCATPNTVPPYNPQYYETTLPAGNTTCEQANMREVYMVTSLSKLGNGSRKMTQYEISPISLPPLPSTITLDGSGPLSMFSPPHSNALTINGADNCSVVGQMPAMGGYDTNSTNNIIADIPSNKVSRYQGSGGTPSVVNVNSTLGTLATVGGLETLTTNIETSADQSFGSNPTISSLGTTTNPMITVVNGDYTWNPNTTSGGAGLLLVTGALTIGGSGNATFNGVILVVGKGQLISNGNGNATINGGLLVANLYDGSGALLSPSSNPGIPSFTWNGAGSLTLNYDSCWMTNLSGRIALRVLASHEEVY